MLQSRASPRRRYFFGEILRTFTVNIMRKSPGSSIVVSLCVQGLLLVSGHAQNSSPAQTVDPVDNRSGAPVDGRISGAPANGAPATGGTVSSDGRVGVPLDGPGVTPANYTSPSANGPVTTPANYTLGPEDQITVRVFAADDIPDRPATIGNDGSVTLPMIGKVHAAGLTVDQFEAALVADYKKYFKDPQVTVTVNDFRSQPVSVAGNVNTPGVVQLRGNRNLMEVIGQAGGLRADAGDSVLITRNLNEGAIPIPGAFTDASGKYSVAHVNIRDVMSGKNPQGNIAIKAHDVISIPRARMVYVLGDVTRPGGYVMQENETMSLTQAVALAGGWSTNASLKSARVLRVSSGAEREQIPANIKAIMNNKAPDLDLRPDDILYVPNSVSRMVTTRGLEAAIGIGTGLLIWR
jgi:polysaccharide biosynthesis/export protein